MEVEVGRCWRNTSLTPGRKFGAVFIGKGARVLLHKLLPVFVVFFKRLPTLMSSVALVCSDTIYSHYTLMH